MDKRSNNGGARKGAGRPKKVDEEKVNNLFATALKKLYKKDDSDEAKIAFIQDLANSQRGQIFIAEHVFGKAPQTLDVNTSLEGTLPIDEWVKDRSKK